jgi:methionyl-tRNA formyltransferase
MTALGNDYKTIYSVHWHWRIPMARHKVIGFHMTDLPFGRGPHPWERMRKHIDANRHLLGQSGETIVTGFLMDTGLDTGTVLIKRIINFTDDKKETLRLAYQACKEMMEILDTWGPTMWIPQEEYRR